MDENFGRRSDADPTKSEIHRGCDRHLKHRRHRSGHRNRASRSLYGKTPFSKFGPKAQLYQDTTLTIHDPTSMRLTWTSSPRNVLIIKKLDDSAASEPFKSIIEHLIKEHRMTVIVEETLAGDASLKNDADFISNISPLLRTFKGDAGDEGVDLIITLGGDGTLLHASSLFQQSVPPLMAFSLGSLGFLTPFAVDSFKESVSDILEGGAGLILRSRLKCVVCRKKGSHHASPIKDPEVEALFPSLEDEHVTHNVLNDVVFDRGPSPYLSNIDLYAEGRHVTSVQGDGLIVSTPTGSTAYAAAAGSSIMHPSVPAILITPICPHSLSFRPIILPAGVEIMVTISPDARNSAWASFDGRCREEIGIGDSVCITTSIYPLPSLCASDQLSGWFDSLGQCFNWNERRSQKPLGPDASATPEARGST